MTRFVVAIALGLVAAGAAGCNGSSAQERIDIPDPPFDSLLDEGNAWESSPWFNTMAASRPWIEFPPMTTIVVHHTLGRVPASVDLYLSFDEQGLGAAPVAGNETVKINDVNAMWIELQNPAEPSGEDVDGPFIRIALR